MKLPVRILYSLLALSACFTACEKDDITTEVAVFTEQIIFTSGEVVVMTGRVLAQGEIAVENHGFQIDTDENFSNPIVISLGEKNVPGRFIGETEGLNISLDYYCRTFIVMDGETTVGNVLPFSTASPKVVGFSPKEGNSGTTIIIEGRNLTADTKVIWNDQLVITPDKLTAETFVEFKAPTLTDDPVISLKLVSQGDTLALAEPFEYIIGVWTEEGLLDDPEANVRHFHFQLGNEFVYGLGLVQNILSPKVKVLDINSLQRTTLTFPGSPVEGMFFNQGYFGGGSLQRVFTPGQPVPMSNEFWKYENQGFVQLPPVPAELYKAVCLVVDGMVYIYGGEKPNRVENHTLYVYDISAGTWGKLNDSPVAPRSAFPAFHLNGYSYFVLADGSTHRHHVASDTWDTAADFPVAPAEFGISVMLDGQPYVGMQGNDRVIYTYRDWNDTWRSKKSLPNIFAFLTIGAWVADDKIYVIRAKEASAEPVLWSLDPDAF